MTPAQLKAFEKQLLELQKSLALKAARRIEPNAAEDERADEDAQPLNEMEQAIASNRNKADLVVLAKVRAALKRLEEDPDDFGNCLDCGDEIVMGRLKAMPWVEMCVECQGKKDKKSAQSATRKHLTDYSDGSDE